MRSKYQFQTRLTPRGSQLRGFVLIEILVAILILSLGLLGMVGLQASALKFNLDAKQQSMAVAMASELGDMMRGNKSVALLTTAADNPYLLENFTGGSLSSPPQDCFKSGCSTAVAVAQWEIYDWLTRLNIAYPGVRVQVCYDSEPYGSNTNGLPRWGCSGTGDVVAIKIGWARASTNSDRSNTKAQAFDTVRQNDSKPPSVIYTVTPGSLT
jgi:type IV pilus assembly protein PilV